VCSRPLFPFPRFTASRRRRLLPLLAAAIGVFGSLLVGGWWFTFVAGAPQLDAGELPASKDLRFRIESFPSRAMGSQRRYGVILPPEYDREPTRRYPVIVLLHGGHDNERAFFDKYAITAVLDRLYSAGRLEPAIVISPDGNDHRGSSPLFDPDYYDGPNGKVGTLIGSELPELIAARYRTRSGPGSWALGGFSSGGWGAMNIGLRHLGRYGILFSHDGYFVDGSGLRNSPQRFIGSLPPDGLRRLRIYIDVGSSDGIFLDSSRSFHASLERLGVASEFHVFPGGHGLTGPDVGWNYIRRHLEDSLSFVGHSFRRSVGGQGATP
jgi:enterochelin esterase-like enzyme